MLSYFIVNHGTGPILWLVNIIIYLVVALILWLILQWIAGEFGVPPRVVKLMGLLIFLLLIVSLFL